MVRSSGGDEARSMGRHPNLDLWPRDEHGQYRAEVEGWQLVIKFRPESGTERRAFWFEATWPAGATTVSRHLEEECEIAMARAEEFARP